MSLKHKKIVTLVAGLLIILGILGWLLDSGDQVIVLVPDNYKGELHLVIDSKVKERRSFFEFLLETHTWKSDSKGVIKVRSDSVLYDWHRLQGIYSSGKEIPEFQKWTEPQDLDDPTIFIFHNYYSDPTKGRFFVGTLKEAKESNFFPW